MEHIFLHRRGSSRGGFPRRILVTCAASLLLGMLYYMIFHFSAQDAEESGSLSLKVSYKGAEIVNSISGGRWDASLEELALMLEHPVRKLAHFSEYACMGVLLFLLWSQWISQGWRLRLLVGVWVFLSAGADEFHQYFVPGRYASVADVLLDTCGGVCGMVFCLCVLALWKRMRRRGKS